MLQLASSHPVGAAGRRSAGPLGGMAVTRVLIEAKTLDGEDFYGRKFTQFTARQLKPSDDCSRSIPPCRALPPTGHAAFRSASGTLLHRTDGARSDPGGRPGSSQTAVLPTHGVTFHWSR